MPGTSILLTIRPQWDLLFSRDSPCSGFRETDCEMESCIYKLCWGVGLAAWGKEARLRRRSRGLQGSEQGLSQPYGELRGGPGGCSDWVSLYQDTPLSLVWLSSSDGEEIQLWLLAANTPSSWGSDVCVLCSPLRPPIPPHKSELGSASQWAVQG